MTLLALVRALRRDTAGQDLLEYALLVAFIAMIVYGAVQVTGTRVDALFDTIATTVGAAAGA
jgi:Flp pilus assembly pilin Flp